MMKTFGYKNPMRVPAIVRVVVNTSFGKLAVGKSNEEQRKIQEEIANDLSAMCGQKAILVQAKKSISGYKLRKGMPIAAKVTLRGKRMQDFLERIIHIVLPRSRDFRGIPVQAVDQNGNLTIGIREHIFFPEISPEKVKYPFGLEVTVVTSARTKEEGIKLFRLLGFPLQ